MLKRIAIIIVGLFALSAFTAFAEEQDRRMDNQPPDPPSRRIPPDQLKKIVENFKKQDPRPSINADSAAELVAADIEGLTSVVAAKIIAYREKIGHYRYVEQLLEAGVNRESYEKIKEKVSLRGKIPIPGEEEEAE
jgi:DNA uptake protein ComE-like DNA-binding protein